MANYDNVQAGYQNQPVGTIGFGTGTGGLVGNSSGGAVPGGQDWSWLAPFLTGVGSLATSGLSMSDAGRAAGMADPFGGERGAYQGQLRNYMGTNSISPGAVTAGSQNALGMLMNLLQNPQSLTTMPGYQFGLNQALEGVNRGAGASGLLNSGNRLAALEDRGQSYAQGWQQQMYNELLGNVQANNSVAGLGLQAQGQGYQELANLSGVNAGSPTAAAQALLNGRTNQANSIGAGIGGIANALPGGISALQRLMGSGTPTSIPGGGGGTDPWDLMGNQSAYGLGGGGGFDWTGSDYGATSGEDLTALFGGGGFP